LPSGLLRDVEFRRWLRRRNRGNWKLGAVEEEKIKLPVAETPFEIPLGIPLEETVKVDRSAVSSQSSAIVDAGCLI
jgi:hypothetical protein